jgi:hypothetical protein
MRIDSDFFAAGITAIGCRVLMTAKVLSHLSGHPWPLGLGSRRL